MNTKAMQRLGLGQSEAGDVKTSRDGMHEGPGLLGVLHGKSNRLEPGHGLSGNIAANAL